MNATYDKHKSTRWTQCYHAQSDTHANVRYEVAHDMRTGEWRCNCPARVPCKHIARCREFERERVWTNIVRDMTPDALYDFALALNGRVADGSATEDDMLALRAIANLSGAERAA